MNVLFDIGHPADVFFFKDIITQLRAHGNRVAVAARDKDITVKLLNDLDIEHSPVGGYHHTLLGKFIGMLLLEFRLLEMVRDHEIDVLVGESPYVAHVAKIAGKKSIVYCMNEHAKLENVLFENIADKVVVSNYYYDRFDTKREVRYNGFPFSIYLSPKYFTSDSSILKELSIGPDEKFTVVRFVSWGASHDIGHSGFRSDPIHIVNELERYGRVFISSEKELPAELEKYQVQLRGEKMHSLLSYATLYLGEGGTMACEAAGLGTPSIFLSTLRLGYLDALRDIYGLLYTAKNADEALTKAKEWLSTPGIKEAWRKKREKLLNETDDVVEFSVKLIESTA